MQKMLQTDLGNALAWGLGMFGGLSGLAALLWLIGRMTGGN
jgi:hypothetical protein